MASKNTHYQKDSFSPYEVFQWIKHGALEHINAKKWFGKSDIERFTNVFEMRFVREAPVSINF
ncbi:hypothetical protein [Capnocytophaga canis]|uniref:hypothetical protein n=1 Tax=Capnocytophaga canis TaxID=1848903 RepID=UPI0037D9659F